MAHINSFISRLKDYICYSHIAESASFLPERIEFFYENRSLSPNCIYIAEVDQFKLPESDLDGCFIFLSGSKNSAAPHFPENCTWFILSAPIGKIYNLISDICRETTLSLDSSVLQFQRIWQIIMAGELYGYAEIQGALSNLQFALNKYIQIGIIAFPGTTLERARISIIPYLREFFPNTNITVYRSDILIFFTSNSAECFPITDETQLEKLNLLLKEFDSTLMIGNSTDKYTALCSNYYLVNRTLDIAIKVMASRGKRILKFEDFSIYCMIDLSAQRYLGIKNNEDLLLLVHPAVVFLTKYDNTHNTDLRDVLYYYLLNERNMVTTGETMFRHRNTILNQVKKIEKITRLDLSNPILRQRLIYSCQLMQYFENLSKISSESFM